MKKHTNYLNQVCNETTLEVHNLTMHLVRGKDVAQMNAGLI